MLARRYLVKSCQGGNSFVEVNTFYIIKEYSSYKKQLCMASKWNFVSKTLQKNVKSLSLRFTQSYFPPESSSRTDQHQCHFHFNNSLFHIYDLKKSKREEKKNQSIFIIVQQTTCSVFQNRNILIHHHNNVSLSYH